MYMLHDINILCTIRYCGCIQKIMNAAVSVHLKYSCSHSINSKANHSTVERVLMSHEVVGRS